MTEPTWYEAAKNDIGVKEIPGAKSNPTIIGWAKRIGAKILGMNYVQDDVAWCGLAMSHWITQRGLVSATPAVRAKAWATWGKALDKAKPMLGAVLVFDREGGGHVGFCAGHTDGYLKVLGGNQGNAVSYTWIAKDRCVAQRWPADSTQIPTTAPHYVSRTGAVSSNEA